MLLALLVDLRTKGFSFLNAQPELKKTLFDTAQGYAIEELETLSVTTTPGGFQHYRPSTHVTHHRSAFRFFQGTDIVQPPALQKPYLREWNDYLSEPEQPLFETVVSEPTSIEPVLGREESF
jgi:hypothetical protein